MPDDAVRPGRTGLQLCVFCGSDLVTPVQSREIGGGGRLLLLRCGECGAWREAIAPPGAAKAFDRAVEGLDRERMAAQADAFIAALHRDLIHAGDFR
jgi:hypothetical protein